MFPTFTKVVSPPYVDILQKHPPHVTHSQDLDTILDEATKHNITIDGVQILTMDEIDNYEERDNHVRINRIVIDIRKLVKILHLNRESMTYGQNTLERLQSTINSILLNNATCPINDDIRLAKVHIDNFLNRHQLKAQVIPEYTYDEVESKKQKRTVLFVRLRFVVPIPGTQLEFHFGINDHVDENGRALLYCLKYANK